MVPRLFFDAVDPDRPEAAMAAAAATAFQELPRARGLVVAALEAGEGPGLSLSPWAVDGMLLAAARAGFAAGAKTFLDLDGRFRPTRHRLLRGGCAELPSGDSVGLSHGHARGRARVPEALIGRNLCVMVPLVHVLGHEGVVEAPLRRVLAAFAEGFSLGKDHHPNRVAEILTECTAATIVLVDAGWWAVKDTGSGPGARLHPVGRTVAVMGLSRAGDWTAVDDALARRLGAPQLCTARLSGAPELVVGGPDAHVPWPRATLPARSPRPGPAQGVARMLGALRAPRTETAPKALPRPIPGPLARLWERYASSR